MYKEKIQNNSSKESIRFEVKAVLSFIRESHESGQALLFVVIAMTIALALGIGLSLETINSVSNVADTDTSQRVLAAAEGAAERALTMSNDKLKDMKENPAAFCADKDHLNGTWDAAAGKCYVDFVTNTGDDDVAVRASVTVTEYQVVFDDEHSTPLDISQSNVEEIFLKGYNPGGNATGDIQICWNGPAVLYYRVYNEAGDNFNNIVKYSTAVDCSSGCPDVDNSWTMSNNIDAITGASASPPRPEYQNCTTVKTLYHPTQNPDGVLDPVGLRIRSLGASITDGMIYPTPDLPVQGYRIHAVGELLNPDGTQRVVTVYKSFSYVPSIFDFSFYSKDNLSL